MVHVPVGKKRSSKIAKHLIADRNEIIVTVEGSKLFVLSVNDNSVTAEYMDGSNERTVINHRKYTRTKEVYVPGGEN